MMTTEIVITFLVKTKKITEKISVKILRKNFFN